MHAASQQQGERHAPPPVACDMSKSPDTPAERRDEYARLFAQSLVGRERVGAGIRFRFQAARGLEEWVRDLAAREHDCCPFFDFTVTARGCEIWWDAQVIDDELAREFLDGFYHLPVALA
jgi:hypothetical protein